MMRMLRVWNALVVALAALLITGPAGAQQPRVPDATATLDWLERNIPEIFPGRSASRTEGTLTYRAYPASGNFAGVLDGGLWVVGPVTGAQPLYLGKLSDFACVVFADSCQPAPQPVVDQCLRVPTGQYASGAPLIPSTGPFTLSFWVYDAPERNDFVEFISQGGPPGPFYFGTAAGTRALRAGNAWVNTGVVLPARQWVHLTLTRGADGRGTLYVNGEVAATAASIAYGGAGNGVFRIGSQFGATPSEFFNGCLDELKIWSTARTAAQVREDMRRGVSDPTGLIAYYDFDRIVEPTRLWQANGRAGAVLDVNRLVELLPAADAAGIVAVTTSSGGLSHCVGQCGPHFGAGFAGGLPSNSKGMSWYSTIWPLVREATADLQFGLGSIWIHPDLNALQAASSPKILRMCLDSPFSATELADLGYRRWALWQSNEGGLGSWGSQSFRSAMPKWRANATSNCYKSYVDSPGWGQSSGKVLASSDTGLVQLSNRILVPPDGMTFPLSTNGEVLGQAWMVLPWPEVSPTPAAPTGPNAWTLFFNATNFKGPVAYFMPHYWSDQAQKDPQLAGLGLDTMGPDIGGIASEWGVLPLKQGRDESGTLYTRIPELRFPVDADGRTVITLDAMSWTDQAIAQPFSDWLAGRRDSVSQFAESAGRLLPMTVSSQKPLYQQGQLVRGAENIVRVEAFDGGRSWGFKWSGASAAPGSVATFPSYFRQTGSTREVVDKSAVPLSTGLRTSSFGFKDVSLTAYSPPTPNWWNSDDPGLRGGFAVLSDGSLVEYRWYRFVDQPALRRLNLTATEKQTLQSLVERMHRTWSTQANYLPPPSRGRLASFDPGLLTTPPAGLEVGYVPIVVSQSGQRLGPPLPAQSTATGAGSAVARPR